MFRDEPGARVDFRAVRSEGLIRGLGCDDCEGVRIASTARLADGMRCRCRRCGCLVAALLVGLPVAGGANRAVNARLTTFVGHWRGHSRGLDIFRSGHGREYIGSGAPGRRTDIRRTRGRRNPRPRKRPNSSHVRANRRQRRLLRLLTSQGRGRHPPTSRRDHHRQHNARLLLRARCRRVRPDWGSGSGRPEHAKAGIGQCSGMTPDVREALREGRGVVKPVVGQ